MTETEIQKEIKDTNNDRKVDKTDLLKWLENLDPKEITESLGNAENKDAIKTIIETPVKEAALEVKKEDGKELTDDQKDLLVLSAWLNNQTLVLPDIKASNFDTWAYYKIAEDELTRLWSAQEKDDQNNDLKIEDISWLKIYWARNWAIAPTHEDVVSVVSKITDANHKTEIIKFLKDSKITELQEYLIDNFKIKLYGKNDGKDGLFWPGTYNAIFNLWVTADTDKKDPMLDTYTKEYQKQQTEKNKPDPEKSELWDTIEYISKLSDIPNVIPGGTQYRIEEYTKDKTDLVVYSNNRFYAGNDASWNGIKWNIYKTDNNLTVLKYDNGNIESDWSILDANKKIDYAILKDVLSCLWSNILYWINSTWDISQWMKSFQRSDYPAWYYVSNKILYKEVKDKSLAYSYKYIYNEQTKSFDETHQYIAGKWYIIKDQYKTTA